MIAIATLVASGQLASVWRWPVKSLGGERVTAARLDVRTGLAGDRAHLLVEPDGRVLTARQAPRMLRWSAAYPSAPGEALDPADPPRPVLRAPDGTSWSWDDEGLADALARDLAPEPPRSARQGTVGSCLRRDVTLARDPAGRPDLPGTVLVTTAASLAALGGELGGEVDLRRFRPNLHLELDAPPYAELGWEGALVRLSPPGGGPTVDIELLHPCVRCAIPTRDPDTAERWPGLLRHLVTTHGQAFGSNARVLAAGVVAEGAAAQVVWP